MSKQTSCYAKSFKRVLKGVSTFTLNKVHKESLVLELCVVTLISLLELAINLGIDMLKS